MLIIPKSVFPAFFTLYVSKEKQSSVQAMQFSNGLTNPLGLWLGHLMFDTVWTLILSTLIIIVFATASNVFNGLGFFVSKIRVNSQPLMTETSGLYWCSMELLVLCLHIA